MRLRRWFRRIVYVLVALIAATGAAWLFLQTSPARALITAVIEDQLSSDGITARVSGLEGWLPGSPRIAKLTLADARGAFLTIDDVRGSWSPLALIFGEIVVDDVSVAAIDWQREPILAKKTESGGGGDLPRIAIARLQVGRIVVGPEVTGRAATFKLDASLDILDVAQRAGLTATLVETGSGTAKLEANLAYDWNEGRLKTNLDVADQAAGVLSSLMGLPSDAPLSIKVASQGDLNDWRASLQATGGASLKATGSAAIARRQSWKELSLTINSDIGDLGPERWRGLIKGATSINVVAARSDEGGYRLDRLNVVTPALRADAAGTYDPAARRASGQGQITVEDASRLVPVIGQDVGWRELTLNARLQGEWPNPKLIVDTKATDFAASSVRSGVFTLQLQGTPDRRWDATGLRVALDLNAQAADVVTSDDALARILGGTVALSGQATLVDLSTLENLRAKLGAAAGSVDFAGSATTGHVDGTVSIDASDLTRAGLDGGAVSGKFDVSANLDGGGWRLRGKGSGENVRTGGKIDGLLAGRYEMVVNAVGDSFDGARISSFKLDGPNGAATAHGKIENAAVDIVANVSVSDLAAISSEYGGRAEANLRLRGSVDAPQLSGSASLTHGRLFGRSANTLALKVSEAGNGEQSDLTLVGDFAAKPISGVARLRWLDSGAVQLDNVRFDLASASLSGDATVGRNGLVSGSVDIGARKLEDIADLVETDLAGSISGRLRFKADGARQGVDLALSAPTLRIDDTSFADTVAQGRVIDPFGEAMLDATVRIGAADLDSFDLQSVGAAVKGPIDAPAISVQAKKADSTINGTTVLRFSHPTTISVRTLELARGQNKATLLAPVDVTIEHRRVTISPARFATGGGHLSVGGIVGRTTDLDINADAVPSWISELAQAKPVPVAGSVTGKAHLGDHGVVVFDAKIDRLAVDGDRGPLRNLKASASGRTDRSGADLKVTLDGDRGTSLRGTAHIPFSDDGPLSVDVRGAVDLAIANAFLAVGGDRAKGTVDLTANVGGTLAAPRVSGHGKIERGFWRSADAGFELRNFTAEFVGSDSAISVTKLSGKTPNGGTVGGQGAIRLEPRSHYPIDITLKATNAQLVATELTTIVADVNARVTGALLASPIVSGAVNVGSWEMRIPDRLRRTLTPIKVTHRNQPPDLTPQIEADESQSDTGLSFNLDINVAAPRRVFVKGQGVDAEFGGTAKVAGTIDRPIVNGRFDLRRGTVSVVGRRVALTRGVVTFVNDIEPTIDIAGEMRRENVVATVTVKGKASAPAIALTSTPELPESEILARMLFNKPTQQLSGVEAAQLAGAIGDWTGVTGGTSIFDRARKALGIDALASTTDSAGGSAVGGGSYLGENVYLGFVQGTDTTAGRATVDLDLSDSLKLRGEASPSGDTRVGVAAEWEY
ncbi:MAG: hypothetical protein GC190_17535 [Alphaproteobacteria bacterium]|nr:hypothetical protein [Alphaproteobacteria bacterium]